MKLARFGFACLVCTSVACALLRTATAHAGTQPIVTSDLLRIREVISIDVSRDGARAVYAVKSIEQEPGGAGADPKMTAPAPTSAPTSQPTLPARASPPGEHRRLWRYHARLFLIDLASPDAQPRQLTFGDRFDSAPKFSPDGKRIAFVRTAPRLHTTRQTDDEPLDRPQVWILPVDGGEAWQMTDLPEGAANPQWSPDGRRLLVESQLKFSDLSGTGSPPWPSERPNRAWNDVPTSTVPSPDGTRDQIRAWLADNAQHDNPVVINRLNFQDELSLRGEMRFNHLFLFDVPPTGSALPDQPLTIDRAKRLTSGFFDHADPAFTNDGQSVVYAARKPTDQHPDRVLQTDLWRVNIDGSNDHRMLSLDGWSFASPKPSRDGAVIAFLGTRIDEPAFRQTQLGMASIKGDGLSDPMWLTEEASFPASVDQFEWMALQPALIFTGAMRGGFPLMTVSPALLQPATLIGEENQRPVGVSAFASGGGAIVCAVTSAGNPCVLQIRDGKGVRTLHDLNEWIRDKNIMLPAAGEIARPDGRKIQYWVMEPSHREPGRKYPLCLEMHGGPSAMWGPGESTMWHEFQLLCSWGYGVVYCNPRGSGGYGYEFQRANFQDWGEGPAGDVLAACDQAALLDWVDPQKLVITGGSYAGYLTAWVVAHDNRFKAAVAQRGVYDIATFFGEGNAWRLVQWAFGGNPYEARAKDIIARNSPFTYVTRIRTPLLIMHASSDLRTGVAQSEMLYRALKELGREVEYVRYPNAGHDLSRTGDPRQRMDRLNRIIEFFERYVDNPRRAPEAP